MPFEGALDCEFLWILFWERGLQEKMVALTAGCLGATFVAR